jgi:hypothetical protein
MSSRSSVALEGAFLVSMRINEFPPSSPSPTPPQKKKISMSLQYLYVALPLLPQPSGREDGGPHTNWGGRGGYFASSTHLPGTRCSCRYQISAEKLSPMRYNIGLIPFNPILDRCSDIELSLVKSVTDIRLSADLCIPVIWHRALIIFPWTPH